MRIIKHLIVSLLVLSLVTSLSAASFSAEQQEKEPGMSKEEQKMVQLWKEMATPGENHKHLEYFVGEWESSQKIWTEPGSEPMLGSQDIRVKSLFGGRFTEAYIKFKREFFGVNIEGIVITGYDNYKKEFVSVTFGNDGTGFLLMHGTLDKSGKVRTDYGQVDDYLTSEKVKIKAVTTLVNKDKYTYELYQLDAKGNEIKYMEITYLRKN